MASKKIACLGDPATHAGTISSAGQTKVKASSTVVAVQGAIFNCSDHGPNAIIPSTTKTYASGKLIITEGAVASCGAIIQPPDRKVYVDV